MDADRALPDPTEGRCRRRPEVCSTERSADDGTGRTDMKILAMFEALDPAGRRSVRRPARCGRRRADGRRGTRDGERGSGRGADPAERRSGINRLHSRAPSLEQIFLTYNETSANSVRRSPRCIRLQHLGLEEGAKRHDRDRASRRA